MEPDIENTVGVITKDMPGFEQIGKIAKLSGQVGALGVKLFTTMPEFAHQQYKQRPHICIDISVKKTFNPVKVCSNFILCPFSKKDTGSIMMENGDSLKFHFVQSSFGSTGGYKYNLFMIDDIELQSLIFSKVTGIQVYSSRFDITLNFDFNCYPNDLYRNPDEGAQLFKIMCLRMIGLKKSMYNQENGY